MTDNKTNDVRAVPVELLERTIQTCMFTLASSDYEQLRAILARPADQHPQGTRERFQKWVLSIEHPVKGWLDGHWLRRGDDREGYADEYVQGLWVAFKAFGAQPADQQGETPRATEKDIERWHALIAESPEGPWVMGNGGSFDRQGVKPISDELMSELGQWLRMGYTPWNGRSVSPTDRQFMYLLYYSVQGLVSRVRRAERDLHSAQPATAKVVLPERRELSQSTPYLSDLDHEWNACLDEVAKLNTPQ